MKFDITRQPLVTAFLTLVVLVCLALYAPGACGVMSNPHGAAAASQTAGLAIGMPRELLLQLQAANPAGTKILAALLLVFAGMVTGRLTIRHNLYSASTCLAIPLFGMIACGLTAGTEYLPSSVSALVFALAIKNFGRSFCNGYGFDAIFRASLYVGIVSLIVPAVAPMLLLLPVALLLFHRTGREAAVALAGILLPALAICYVNWGAGGSFIAPMTFLCHTLVDGAPFGMLLSLPLTKQVILGTAVILTLAASAIFLTDLYAVGIRPRFILIFACCAFFTSLLSLCTPAAGADNVLLLAIPAAILQPVLFVRTRRLINLPLYLLLLAGSIASAFLQ